MLHKSEQPADQYSPFATPGSAMIEYIFKLNFIRSNKNKILSINKMLN